MNDQLNIIEEPRTIEERIVSLQKRYDSQLLENQDLRFSLQLNKDLLQSMMAESKKASIKEKNLIETINIISKDNTMLKQQIESLRLRIEAKQQDMVA